jgi:hypothetical protein
MASILDYGAGAHAGVQEQLEQMLAEERQRLLQAQLNETIRSNQADEVLRGRQIDESAATRRQYQDQIEASRQRDDARAEVGMMSPGTKVSPQQRDQYAKMGIPPQLFDMEELNSALDPNFQGPELPPEMVFKGTEAQRLAQEREDRLANAPASGNGQTATKNVNLRGRDVIVQETPDGRLLYQGQDVTNDPSLKPYQAPDRVVIPYTDPVTGTTVLGPRSSAVGRQAPLTGSEREQVHGIDALDSLIDNALTIDEGTWGKAIGPLRGGVAGPLHDYTGWDVTGEGEGGQTLRALINQIRTEASFARGGKQLTPTERAALDSFLATVLHDPATARLRLQDYQRAAQQRRGTMVQGGAGTPASGGGKKRIRYDMNGNVIPD